MRIIRERMVELDFKEEFVEKMLKDFSIKKIEDKLDLLMEKKNIQNPAGWLNAALKNDYQGEERESQPIRIDSRFHGNDIKGSENDNFQIPSPLEGEGLPCVVGEITAQGKSEGDKILSTEEARERFKLLREKLMAMNSP